MPLDLGQQQPPTAEILGKEEVSVRIATRLCLLAVGFALLCMAYTSQGQVIVVSFAPPALPVYEQPLLPGEGYIWTPGYWAWDNGFGDYYWVPGTWVLPPDPGLFWTPPYWGWGNNGYAFYPGYWGPQVGFYGGINYGYGYFGHGYDGGRWDHGHWYYNRAVNNINVENVHNVYVSNVNERNVNRVSYNGGQGGIAARPTAEEERVAHDRHVGPVPGQTQQVQAARGNQQLRASVNEGRPPIAATPKAGAFNERGVVPAKEAGAPYHPPANRAEAGGKAPPSYPAHAKDVQPHTMPPPNTGNAKQDQKYQKQQQQLEAQQEKEHQKLAQQQEQDHQRQAQQQQREQQQHAQQQQEQQRTAQQQANAERNRQMEQTHQQQTQQMEERHAQQQQQMQVRQQPASHGAPPPGHGAPPEKH